MDNEIRGKKSDPQGEERIICAPLNIDTGKDYL
jgi:hypothetical protein